ncbi:hypothetical protein OG920_26045 [Streptomyces europaeiscabiei]|uniref:hypothetical protein n=1 Tax=Streptomyces europaeiscabiei TaxID=146819 RepID=UPI002E19A31D
MTCLPVFAFSFGDPSAWYSGTRSVPMPRKPSCRNFLRQVGSPNLDLKRALLARAKSFNACCCTSAFPEPSHSLSRRASVS